MLGEPPGGGEGEDESEGQGDGDGDGNCDALLLDLEELSEKYDSGHVSLVDNDLLEEDCDLVTTIIAVRDWYFAGKSVENAVNQTSVRCSGKNGPSR